MEWYDTFEEFHLPKDYTLLCVTEPLDFRIGKDFKDHLSIGYFLFNLDYNLVRVGRLYVDTSEAEPLMITVWGLPYWNAKTKLHICWLFHIQTDVYFLIFLFLSYWIDLKTLIQKKKKKD